MYKKFIFILVILFFTGCTNNYSLIEGKYLSNDNKKLSKVELGINLTNENKESYDYYVNLETDGSFKLKVKQKGNLIFNIGLFHYPSREWKAPKISNDMIFYFNSFEDGKVIKLEEQYISDAIEVSKPLKNSNYDNSEKLKFEWDKNKFADFYDLSIFKIDNMNKKVLFISTHNIKSNKVSYQEIKTLALIKNKISLEESEKMSPFNRKFSDLKKGKYELKIMAYKVWKKENKLLLLSETWDMENIYFYISE